MFMIKVDKWSTAAARAAKVEVTSAAREVLLRLWDWGLGFRDWSLGFRVWDLGFGVQG